MPSVREMFGAPPVETFLGVEKADLDALGAGIVVLGADCATTYSSVGAYCAGGAAAIRDASGEYATTRAHVNFDLGHPSFAEGFVVDAGDVPTDPSDGAASRAAISDTVGKVLDASAVPILLGGDDSLPVPLLSAYAGRGDLTILQIDAHIDWRDEVQGETEGLSSVMRRASEMPHVTRMVQVGQRGIGSAREGEYQAALDWGVEFVSGSEVARDGVQRAIDLVPEGSRVVICFDCDGLDPAVMPAVLARTAGGLSYWQALHLIEGVAAKASIEGMALTEFVPDADIDGQGAMTAAQLVATVMGLIARQRAG